MTKYLIEYECAHWCGGESHVVVNADSENLALEKAGLHMHEDMYELFNEEYRDCLQQGTYEDGETTFAVKDIQEFNSDHEYWKFYKDPTQKQFFPEIF
jgi:hypothetical protein